MNRALMVFLAGSVAAGYFTIAGLVAPRIRIPSADNRMVHVVRGAAIAFFIGCGMTHLHILVHTLGYGSSEPVETHELGFHVFQAVGAWLFIAGALMRFELHVMPSQTRAVLEAKIEAQRLIALAALQAATTDDLTGLARRGRFDEELATEVARAERYGRPGALILIDVDGMKGINDANGHQAGDDALQRVADMFRRHLRSFDTAARIGGDEFAIILPETTIEASGEVANRLVTSMRDATDEGTPQVSLSIGVAPIDGSVASADLLRQADLALYASKRGGGDRHTVASPGPDFAVPLDVPA